MSITTNFLEVRRGLYELRNALTFRGPGRYRTNIGRDAADLVGQGVVERTVLEQRQPDGRPLAPLAPSTVARKARRGYPNIILVETGEMMSLSALLGNVWVAETFVEMTYNGSAFANDKAEWATEGHKGKPRRPKRPFYELNSQIIKDLDTLIIECFDRNAVARGCT